MAQYDINKIQLPNGDICNIIAALDRFYPVGSIYISINSTNPGTIFGGTWTSFGAGRVLVGVDPEDEDFNTAGNTGGEKEHTLTISEMPSHNHYLDNYWSSGSGSKSAYTMTSNRKLIDHYSGNTGGNLPHNNLQPYITCYMWLRTA